MIRRFGRVLPPLLVAVGVVGAAPTWAGAAAASIPDFAGVWRGTEITGVEGDAPLDPTLDELNVTIVPERDGFRVTWERPDGGRIEAAFAPADRPGVFFVRPSTNPLLGLFFSPATGSPLEGETLLWSRLEGDTLVVYSLKLERDGAFALHRYAWTLEDRDSMTLDFSRLSEGLTRAAFSGRLTRAAG